MRGVELGLDELPEELRDRADLPVSPLLKQRRWARISHQYRIEFRKGADAHAAVQAVAAQRSARHRDTSDGRMRQVEAAMEVDATTALLAVPAPRIGTPPHTRPIGG